MSFVNVWVEFPHVDTTLIKSHSAELKPRVMCHVYRNLSQQLIVGKLLTINPSLK